MDPLQQPQGASEITVNQAMRFGDLPGWALELGALVRREVEAGKLWPPEVMLLLPVHSLHSNAICFP